MKRQILRKETKRKVVGGTEFIENSYSEENLLTNDEFGELDGFFDDYEEAFDAGIIRDSSDEIICIEIDQLLESLAEYINDDHEDEFRTEMFSNIERKLRDWRTYTMWL